MAWHEMILSSAFLLVCCLLFCVLLLLLTHRKASPKYRESSKWNRCWHLDAEGGCWNRPYKAAGEGAPVVTASEPWRNAAGVNTEPDGFALFLS